MRALTLAWKELKDILSEKVYLFTFFLQMFIIVGILLLGVFYSQIQTTVNYVGPVYVVTDDESFKAQLRLDKRVTVVSDQAAASTRIVYLDGTMSVEVGRPDMREGMERVVRDAYIQKKYAWHEVPNMFNTVYIEIMGTLFVPLILLLPLFISMNILSDSIIAEKERKTLEILLASPATPRDIALGKVLPVLVLSSIQVVAWTFLLKLRYPFVYNLPLLFAFMLILSFVLFTIAIISSTVASTLTEANLFLTGFLMLMAFLMFVPQDRFTLFSAYSPLSIIVEISSNMGLDYARILRFFSVYTVLMVTLLLLASRLLREDRFTRL